MSDNRSPYFQGLLLNILIDQQWLVGRDNFAGQSNTVLDGGEFFAVSVGKLIIPLDSSSRAT